MASPCSEFREVDIVVCKVQSARVNINWVFLYILCLFVFCRPLWVVSMRLVFFLLLQFASVILTNVGQKKIKSSEKLWKFGKAGVKKMVRSKNDERPNAKRKSNIPTSNIAHSIHHSPFTTRWKNVERYKNK